jgi:release factor glutamine methyltransferase
MIAVGVTAAAAAAAGAVCRDVAKRFRDAGLDTPELDARILVASACGRSRADLIRDPDVMLTPDQIARVAEFTAQRLARMPVSRIIGSREFWGRRFLLSPDVLDPRPDTETLIEAALTIVKRKPPRSRPLHLLDLGVGSGCILATLLLEVPDATGTGIDISAAALSIARANAGRHGLASRMTCVQADFMRQGWQDAVEGPFDLIVSNPPYIPSAEIQRLEPEVSRHDPIIALDGGSDGLAPYRMLLGSRLPLAPDGALLWEVGQGQAPEVAALLRDSFGAARPASIEVWRDLAGIERVVAAT